MAGMGTLVLAGRMLGLSAVLHVVAGVMTGFGPVGGAVLVVAVIFAVLALGLVRGMRALGYFGFVLVLAGTVAAYAMAGNGAAPDWVIWAIVAANLLALINLFAALWRPASPA